jgi:hypothetical protein
MWHRPSCAGVGRPPGSAGSGRRYLRKSAPAWDELRSSAVAAARFIGHWSVPCGVGDGTGRSGQRFVRAPWCGCAAARGAHRGEESLTGAQNSLLGTAARHNRQAGRGPHQDQIHTHTRLCMQHATHLGCDGWESSRGCGSASGSRAGRAEAGVQSLPQVILLHFPSPRCNHPTGGTSAPASPRAHPHAYGRVTDAPTPHQALLLQVKRRERRDS